MTDAPSSRVISQIGDSSEDDETADDTELLQKFNNYTFNPIEYKGNVFHINVPVVLKSMGLLILKSENVKREYRKIKQNFVPPDKKLRFKELDEQIGRGWGWLLEVIFERQYKFLLKRQVALNSYFRLNYGKINEKLSIDKNYNLTREDQLKLDDYLEKVIDIYKIHSEIQELNRSIERVPNNTEKGLKYTENYKIARENTKRIKSSENRDDAVLFLARLKGSMKLDKDVVKNALYDYKKAEYEYTLDRTKARPENKTWRLENKDFTHEELEIILENGKISHLRRLGSKSYSYRNLAESTDKDMWLPVFPEKALLRNILRDKFDDKDYEIKNNPDLQVFVELVFGIEVKRNPGALLTNAMFLDLLYGKKYSRNDFASKLPMALSGAVHGSTIIDVLAQLKVFDYRPQQFSLEDQEREWYKKSHLEFEAEKVYGIVNRDENVLKDWLEYLRETRGEKYFIASDEVSGEAFFDLIKDWYGIEILGLKNGTLKINFSTINSTSNEAEAEVVSTITSTSNEAEAEVVSTIKSTSNEAETEVISTIKSTSNEAEAEVVSTIKNTSNEAETEVVSTIKSTSNEAETEVISTIKSTSNEASHNTSAMTLD